MYVGAIRWGPTVYRTLAARTIDVMGDLLPAEDFPSPVRLDVVFHVGGPLGEPEFTGVRTGSYSRKQNIAQVQIAVTSGESEEPTIPGVMVDRLILAIEVLAARLKRSKVDVPADVIRSMIEARRGAIVQKAPIAVPREPGGCNRVTGEWESEDIEALVAQHMAAIKKREQS
jgi:hypothetical protein